MARKRKIGKRKIRRLAGRGVRKFLPLFFLVSCSLSRFLPPRFTFSAIVLLRFLLFRAQKILINAFLPVALKYQQDGKKLCPAFVARKWPKESAAVLVELRAFNEIIDLFWRDGRAMWQPALLQYLARAFFELADFTRSEEIARLGLSRPDLPEYAGLCHLYGKLALIAGKEKSAIEALLNAATVMPWLYLAHQNMAAHGTTDYQPHPLDLTAGVTGRLFDAYNLIGQMVTHVGAGHLGTELYGKALSAQKQLRCNFPILSPALETFLAERNLRLEDLRLLPPEWVSQIGHLGMMDILFRMRDLGWWQGNAVILAPPAKVANGVFLSLFKNQAQILAPGASLPITLAAELISLQRYCGMAFNAFALPDEVEGGKIVPWQEAGALAIRQWESEGRGHPLREEFDSSVDSMEIMHKSLNIMRSAWGMSENDWYVCLHLRDAAHYGEITGSGQTHRNASTESYLAAIRSITDQGGWVIKMGGPYSVKLPSLPRVVDYALSGLRTPALDLHLIRHARFFIGTTSGLTNVAISFGVPCALVNCITVDAQLWNSRVRFVPKTIRVGNKMLTQHDLTAAPWRWRQFSAETLRLNGAVAIENTSDEILETVKEVDALATGGAYPADERLLATWNRNLDMPHYYGNARINSHYLQKYANEFLSEAIAAPVTPAVKSYAYH